MSIRGIGTDIVAIDRIARMLTRYPQRLPQRILTNREWPDPAAQAPTAALLARRFAAKEAAAKALGTGFADGIRFGDFEVAHDPAGCPQLRLTGQAAVRACQLGIERYHLSISDEREYALAFVVVETATVA